MRRGIVADMMALGGVITVLTVGTCAKKSPPTAAARHSEMGGEAVRRNEDQIADGRRRRIEEEIGRLKDHPWAGQYYMGDGLGMNVSIWVAPEAGFLFEWHGCLGLYARNYGRVVAEGKQVQLECERAQDWNIEQVGTKLEVVNWGQRHYLVSSAKMAEFCASVDSTEARWGREPRLDIHGRYLLKWGDENKPVDGKPDVPEAYRARVSR